MRGAIGTGAVWSRVKPARRPLGRWELEVALFLCRRADEEELADPGGTTIGRYNRCGFCQGTGTGYRARCSICQGEGAVPMEGELDSDRDD